MILETLEVDVADFEQRTGWTIKPQGACKDERCVPLPASFAGAARIDVRELASRLVMPLIQDQASGLWCLGPQAGGRALVSSQAPEVSLPDLAGKLFNLSSLRGRKVLLLAWASW